MISEPLSTSPTTTSAMAFVLDGPTCSWCDCCDDACDEMEAVEHENGISDEQSCQSDMCEQPEECEIGPDATDAQASAPLDADVAVALWNAASHPWRPPPRSRKFAHPTPGVARNECPRRGLPR